MKSGSGNRKWFLSTAMMVCVAVSSHAAVMSEHFSYDGTYDPYSATPPLGQSTWTNLGGALTPVWNSPSAGLARFTDNTSGARVTVAKPFSDTSFIANPAPYEWEYGFRMQIHSRSGGAYHMFGVRDEGGAGRTVMFAFAQTNSNLLYTDNNGNGVATFYSEGVDGPSLIGDGLVHEFRVVKKDVGGTMKVRFYLDGDMKDERDYASFPLDASGAQGFGFYSSTPALIDATLDCMQVGGSVQLGAAIPEPATGVLLGLCLGLLIRRRCCEF